MPMSPRLLRPRSTVHPEAQSWAARVTANGGTFSGATLSALSKFCRDIDAAGIRDRFYRLNLLCGANLSAALVPLYRAESSTSSVRGNTTDTNNGPFVAADFNTAGSSSGLKADGTTKFLDTGVPGNTLTGTNVHFGFGLRATQTGGAAYRTLGGVYNGIFPGGRVLDVSARRNDSNLHCACGDTVASSTFGESVQSASLAVGDLVCAYPSFYRNGVRTGTDATAGAAYPRSDSVYIFALNQAGTTVNRTDARLNWYSIGLTMTAAQAAAFTTAVQAFNTTLSRT